MKPEPLKILPRGDREVVITRGFAAPSKSVFTALTKPELLREWLLGPPGWTMPVCDVDLRKGGTYRYVWRNEEGVEMGMGGVYKEVRRPDYMIHTEQFDQPWYPGQAVITTILIEKDGITNLTGTVLYETKEARDTVLKSPMEKGVASSYKRLDDLLQK
jgi:uncharacterized protein YndB with AHSA1/START domain